MGQPLFGEGLVISAETPLLPENGAPDGVIGPPVSLAGDANEDVGHWLGILSGRPFSIHWDTGRRSSREAARYRAVALQHDRTSAL